jgi:hypothetical protein
VIERFPAAKIGGIGEERDTVDVGHQVPIHGRPDPIGPNAEIAASDP